MSCKPNCCGPSNKAPSPPISIRENENCCNVGVTPQVIDKACDRLQNHDSTIGDELMKRCDQPQPTTSTYHTSDSCCGETTSIRRESIGDVAQVVIANDRSTPEPERAKSSCNKGCCSARQLPGQDETKAPSCCDGKAAPCCDQSCLDRLALRECKNPEPSLSQYNGQSSSQAPNNCNQGKDDKPCADHIYKARKLYAEKLEALGCICRALTALGKESCCSPQYRSSMKGNRGFSQIKRLHPRSSVDSCYDTSGADVAACSTNKRSDFTQGCRNTRRNRATEPKTSYIVDSCASSCYAKDRQNDPIKQASTNANETIDIEKGISKEYDHVILSISGMTCTGCETKLLRSLGTNPSVRNLKTSLVLARAEFDLVGTASLVEVMKHLERTTEFKCERVMNQGSSLDIIVSGSDAAATVSQAWPEGVTEVRVVDKGTLNVRFDAEVIGARDLLERGWGDGPVSLAAPGLDSTLEAGSKHVRHVGYMTLLSACLTVPVLVMAWAPIPERHLAYGSASLALATLVQFVVAGPFYPKALKALLFSRVIEMDLLVVLSTSAAYIFSVVSFGYMVSGQPLSTGEFFETSTLLVTLIMVGRWMSAWARQRAVESITVRSLQSPTALVVNGIEENEIDSRLLQYGDVFKVAPHTRMPTDGTVISGSSEVDESMVTGESRPVEKHAKSAVIAGSVNGSGMLLVRLTRLPSNNTINTIAGMVDEAKLSKPKIQQVADRVAGYFVPVVIALAIITFCIWIVIGVAVRGQSGSEATIQAVTYSITVLIVSCPCAVGLAVPMVIVIASNAAAERGVIFKSAEGIEVAYKTSHVVFDKTGTITKGKLIVAQEWYAGDDQDTTKSLLLGLVGNVKHPVSVAVVTHLKAQSVSPVKVSDQETLTGNGVRGTTDESGFTLQAGNSRWLGLTSEPAVQSVLSQGYTAFCFSINGSVAAIFGLQDSVRSDAAFVIKTLLDRNISVHMISGDDDGAVRSVAAQLNISESNVRSRCTPADKQAYIRSLLDGSATQIHASSNEKNGNPVVIFCGDGTNDAVALAQATIGVHINEGGGTDVAKSAADIVLMRPNLAGILTVIAVSKKSMHRIVFNFGWSFVYNLFAILLAAGAFVNARIPPRFAGLGELVSVLPVIAAATLLRWVKI